MYILARATVNGVEWYEREILNIRKHTRHQRNKRAAVTFERSLVVVIVEVLSAKLSPEMNSSVLVMNTIQEADEWTVMLAQQVAHVKYIAHIFRRHLPLVQEKES